MKVLFDKEGASADQELKGTLGFLDGGFSYKNIEPDIKLNVPYLVDLTSQEVYDKVYLHYTEPDGQAGDELTEQLNSALLYMQLYLASMAYLDYAADNDLNHGNAGRSFRSEENEKIPWEWQVDRSDRSIRKRAYRALDHLMALLDSADWSEWTESDQYTAAKARFIQSTSAFDAVYPIGNSGQLYYRLVPFMKDIETHKVAAVLTPAVTDALREKEDPTPSEKTLIELIRKAVAYLSLAEAYKMLPVEIMPDGLFYNENTRMKSEARAEVMQHLKAQGEKYLVKLEYEHSQQNATFEARDATQGLEDDNKFVHL